MNPRLLVVAGPLRGSTYVLSAKEVQIGRDSSNAFAIGDPALSRRHCVLACEGNDYIIRDLQSRNGTLINGVAAQKRGLQHGDQISVGDSVFLFLSRDEAEAASSEAVEFKDEVTHATIQMRLQDARYLQPNLMVNELPASSRVARNLQEREFERLGGIRPIAVDIRLIAASNRNLGEAVKMGLFRADLFYRLNVVNLVMPPLRNRREDIPSLANYFVTKYSNHLRVKAKALSPGAMACLVNYDWPGNVRELENAIERALVLGVADSVQPEDLPESVLEKDLPPGAILAEYHAALRETKKQLIVRAVHEAKGNYTDAAGVLGVHPNYLHRLIRNLGVKDALRSAANLQPTGTTSKTSS